MPVETGTSPERTRIVRYAGGSEPPRWPALGRTPMGGPTCTASGARPYRSQTACDGFGGRRRAVWRSKMTSAGSATDADTPGWLPNLVAPLAHRRRRACQ